MRLSAGLSLPVSVCMSVCVCSCGVCQPAVCPVCGECALSAGGGVDGVGVGVGSVLCVCVDIGCMSLAAVSASCGSLGSRGGGGAWEGAGEDVLLEELSRRFRGVLPVQPSPVLLAPDQTPCSLKSTMLAGHLIYCFVVGGECRLCFPQIISVVLPGVRPGDVNELFAQLNIHMSVASPQQLDTLKVAGVMPISADSCGLVTKSDAERLVARLLPQSSGPLGADVPRGDALPVVHDCFGGAAGVLLPSLAAEARIECSHCKLMFTGEKFVSHSHSTEQIRRICHWGFDSSNWKYYLRLPEHCEDDAKALRRLQLYKYPPVRLGKRSAPSAADADADAATDAHKVRLTSFSCAASRMPIVFTACYFQPPELL